MRLSPRRWVRTCYNLRGKLFIAFIFLVYTLHVITQKQISPEDTRDDTPDTDEQQLPLGNTLPSMPDILRPRHHFSITPYNDWVEASGSNRDFFLYSAYLRKHPVNRVTIIAIVKRRKKVTLCDIWTGKTSKSVKATVKFIRENWNLAYIAAFIHCPVPTDLEPTHVSLADYPNTLIPVQNSERRERVGQLSVCVKPLHYQYDRALWLVEFIEFYRLLGADHFIFYNHTMGRTIEAVVGHYVKEGVVTLLPWSLPVVTQKEIRTEGIFAALNDCSLRSINRFTFSAMVDFDEFLVPRKHRTLLQLIASYDKEYSSYVFQNVFFYLYWENDTIATYDKLHQEGIPAVPDNGEPYLLTPLKTRRLTTPHKHNVRSKYIVRPERVVELGNHQVWEYVGAKSVKQVPDTDGLSHHYRICEYGGFDCLKKNSKVDRTTHKWLAPLYQNVMSQCSLIFPEDGKCPPAPPLGSPF